MGIRVNTNISALQTQTSLKKASAEVEESSAKMSSGERINKAADDAAGLAISEKLKAHIRSGRQANRNANDGLSLVQIAEGGLNETSGLLTRMRELAVQAASDTVADSDRQNSDLEYQAVKNEIERLSKVTEFNGRKLLDGSGGDLSFQVGTGDNSSDDHLSVSPRQMNATLSALGLGQERISSKQGALASLGRIDQAINKVASYRSVLGSIQNRLLSSSNNLQIYTENMAASNSRIRDTDYAMETANHVKSTIMQDAGTAVLAQAKTHGQAALKLLE